MQTELTDFKGLRSAITTEVLFVGITCMFGFMGFWQGFAVMAFLSVLVPLWIGAVAAVICAFGITGET